MSAAWTQVAAFACLLVFAWWIGPFPHSEPVDEPDLFDPRSKSWHAHSTHAYTVDPGLALAKFVVDRDNAGDQLMRSGLF